VPSPTHRRTDDRKKRTVAVEVDDINDDQAFKQPAPLSFTRRKPSQLSATGGGTSGETKIRQEKVGNEKASELLNQGHPNDKG